MTPTVPLAVSLKDVEFRYRSEHEPTLAISSFQVAQGERVFLQGPSGSGKSTLLSVIAGVLTPQSGTVEVIGQDLGKLGQRGRDHHRAANIGLVFQLFNLIPYLTMRENVALAGEFAAERRPADPGHAEVDRLLGQFNLEVERLGRKTVTELSVGEQQRVAAARALYGGPALVIADEPTSALDADTRDQFIVSLLAETERAGSAVLFVSHDQSLARHFDREVHLAAINGREG